MSEKKIARVHAESPRVFTVDFEGGNLDTGKKLVIELKDAIMNLDEMKEAKEAGYEIPISELIVPWEKKQS